jgi:hypothetical protein
MPNVWLPWTLTAAAAAAAVLFLLTRRPKPLVFANPREERLTRKMARIVGCSLGQALPAVRREVDLAPSQSDETLVKRAAYHYRQELPETSCPVYRDKAPG